MSDLSPRPKGRMNRAERVDRAYQLVVAGGTMGVATVALAVLAILNIVPFTVPVLTLIVTIVCLIMFRRITSPQRRS